MKQGRQNIADSNKSRSIQKTLGHELEESTNQSSATAAGRSPHKKRKERKRPHYESKKEKRSKKVGISPHTIKKLNEMVISKGLQLGRAGLLSTG
jgi:hypothetical protein